MRHVIPCVVLLALTACLTERASQRGRDRDRDGHDAWQLDGSDCDDDNPAVNPDQPEACGNGIDDNCDGLVDNDGLGGVTWYSDLDGDGAVGTTPSSGCEAPAGSRPDLAGVVDCDDGDASVHPRAVEVWYDGVDQDCDGNDADQDGDGELGQQVGGTDCDDTQPAVNSAAEEICNNGVDDNCDGEANHCAVDATRTVADAFVVIPSRAEAVRILDLNDDGVDDLVIHETERTSAYFGPLSGLVPSGSADLRVTHSSGSAGRAVDFANLDNIPPLDWVVGDRSEERVAVWWNPTSESARRDVVQLPTLIEAQGLSDTALFGRSLRVVRGVAPASGDGLVVGSRYSTTMTTGGTFDLGIRFFAGPWTNGALAATSSQAMAAGVDVEQFGGYQFFGLTPVIVFVGESGGVNGLYAASVPYTTSDTTMVVYPPLLVTPDSFPEPGDYLLNLPGSRDWRANGAPFPLSFFGLTATGELSSGGGFYPSNVNVVDLQRSPTAIDELAFVATSQVPIGNPDGESAYLLVDRCAESPFGEVFISAIQTDEGSGESIRTVLAVDDVDTPIEQSAVFARDLSASDFDCGDLDGDGVDDLLVVDAVRERVFVFRGTTL